MGDLERKQSNLADVLAAVTLICFNLLINRFCGVSENFLDRRMNISMRLRVTRPDTASLGLVESFNVESEKRRPTETACLG